MTRDECIALMIELEGGEAYVKGDPGGHTKYGIIQTTLDSVRERSFPIVLPANVADLLPGDAAYIYRSVQWHDIRGDDLPSTLAPLVLNAAVNMGEPRAVMLLQAAVGAHWQDGIVGSNTLSAITNWCSPYGHGQTLAEEYAAHVAARYAFIDNKNSDLTQFEIGWFRRLFRVYTLAVLSTTANGVPHA